MFSINYDVCHGGVKVLSGDGWTYLTQRGHLDAILMKWMRPRAVIMTIHIKLIIQILSSCISKTLVFKVLILQHVLQIKWLNIFLVQAHKTPLQDTTIVFQTLPKALKFTVSKVSYVSAKSILRSPHGHCPSFGCTYRFSLSLSLWLYKDRVARSKSNSRNNKNTFVKYDMDWCSILGSAKKT